MMLTCRICGERKSCREFYSDGAGGVRTDCAACNRATARDRYRIDPDYRQRRQTQTRERYWRNTGRAA